MASTSEIKAAAERIAQIANECCARSDGYEAEIESIAAGLLSAAARDELADVLKDTRHPRAG